MVFALEAHGEHLGEHGAPVEPMGVPWAAQKASRASYGAPTDRPWGAKAYIHKLPIHRHRAAAAGNPRFY